MKNPATAAFEPWAEAAAQTLAALLTTTVLADEAPDPTPLSDTEWDQFIPEAFALPLTLSGPVSGPMLLAIEADPAKFLAGMMLGEAEIPDELSKLHKEVLNEAIQQIASNLPECLAITLGMQGISVVDGTSSFGKLPQLGAQLYQAFKFPFEVEGQTIIVHLLVPSMLAEEISNTALVQNDRPTSIASAGPQIQQAQFQQFSSRKHASGDRDLDLILDVPMKVTAVLGTTSISMEELINLGQGSVLELDKLAGEPVELFVHGRQVAVGEVVVIDERFGVKILSMAKGRGSSPPGLTRVV